MSQLFIGNPPGFTLGGSSTAEMALAAFGAADEVGLVRGGGGYFVSVNGCGPAVADAPEKKPLLACAESTAAPFLNNGLALSNGPLALSGKTLTV
jgi:hypothetical protein